jgi:RecJ-like exonuclease
MHFTKDAKLILNFFLDRPLLSDTRKYEYVKTVTQVAKLTGKNAEDMRIEIELALRKACPVFVSRGFLLTFEEIAQIRKKSARSARVVHRAFHQPVRDK